jgi:hypothetical protein
LDKDLPLWRIGQLMRGASREREADQLEVHRPGQSVYITLFFSHQQLLLFFSSYFFMPNDRWSLEIKKSEDCEACCPFPMDFV